MFQFMRCDATRRHSTADNHRQYCRCSRCRSSLSSVRLSLTEPRHDEPNVFMQCNANQTTFFLVLHTHRQPIITPSMYSTSPGTPHPTHQTLRGTSTHTPNPNTARPRPKHVKKLKIAHYLDSDTLLRSAAEKPTSSTKPRNSAQREKKKPSPNV
ncbi:uncharacterized protein LY89DRAFT_679304 [Mollisia scopiformis]|uniref:Uncharacterized protein n=1 Tax=Mollisia scopiformis TaxID=149040 RepID=A0A194XWE8_MOLSC|nr:uncharacterized protein LY89DRAFT_679304 [Mollisia scopiformis]KUJ24052.1 hypothetical protein LY89DRAFT_679304 [Mollisia scopiformis]